MKVLLLTDIPPCTNYTAGLVLEKLCRFFAPGEIACFSVLDKHLSPELFPDLDWIPNAYCTRPKENGGVLLPGPLGVASSLAFELYSELIETSSIIDQAVRFGKKFGAEKVWCVLEGQTMIRVAQAVADGIGCPLLVQVWDPLEWWLRAHKVNKWSSAQLLRQFTMIMKNCGGCFAVSSFMAEDYIEKYGVRAVDFTPSLDEDLAYHPAEKMHSEHELIFAMAGQLYALDEWTALLNALNGRDWKISGRDVRIILLGNHDCLKIPTWAVGRIEKTGWLSQSEALATCHSADLLYCPYWFSALFEQEARLSFPSKITTYFASGRPVFFHGPRYASPARFLEKYNAGYICDSNREVDICLSIERIVNDPVGYERMTHNANIAFKQNMTTSVLKSKFYQFLQEQC